MYVNVKSFFTCKLNCREKLQKWITDLLFLIRFGEEVLLQGTVGDEFVDKSSVVTFGTKTSKANDVYVLHGSCNIRDSSH